MCTWNKVLELSFKSKTPKNSNMILIEKNNVSEQAIALQQVAMERKKKVWKEMKLIKEALKQITYN